MDEDGDGPNRGGSYRKTARLLRERAAKLTTKEARDTLTVVALDYERLASYVETFWESAAPREPKSASVPKLQQDDARCAKQGRPLVR